MSIAEIRQNAEHKMNQSLEALKTSLSKVRTGRPNPQILDTVHVEYYGSMLPLSQVANLSLLDARTIGVAPWEKGMGAKIEKAIRESDLGLNPASQGDLIRVPMPPMTEERRKELTKVVKGEGEAAKGGYPQPASRCQRARQEIAEGQAGVGRRRAPCPRRHPEADRPDDWRGRPDCRLQGAGHPGGLIRTRLRYHSNTRFACRCLPIP